MTSGRWIVLRVDDWSLPYMMLKKAEILSAVGFKNSNGTLQLVFTHPTERTPRGDRKQKYVSTGLPDTNTNRQAVRVGFAADIEKNLALGTIDEWLAKREAQKLLSWALINRFSSLIDEWLAKREAQKQPAIQASEPTLSITLNQLWKLYTQWATKAKGLAESLCLTHKWIKRITRDTFSARSDVLISRRFGQFCSVVNSRIGICPLAMPTWRSLGRKNEVVS